MGMTIVTEIDSANGRLVDPHVTDSERHWAVFTHLSGFATFILTGLGIVFPLIIWLAKKKESPFLDDHGCEVVNFQLSMLLYSIIGGILTCGVLTIVALVVDIIFMIVAAVAASRGEYYRYPLTIRFLS